VPSFPFTTNSICDIAHAAGGSLNGLPCHLNADYERHAESGEGESMSFRYTHVMLIAQGTNIEDQYTGGTQVGGQDTVYIPSGAGGNATPFTVQFVETKAWNTPWAYLKVYLDRGTPPWPTKYL